jgi:hypothetical protein
LLPDIAVRRARGLGSGGNVANIYYFTQLSKVSDGSVLVKVEFEDGDIDVPVLAPELTGIVKVLAKVLGRVDEVAPRDAISELDPLWINPKSLPVEVQLLLKRVAETIVVVGENMKGNEWKSRGKLYLMYTGSLLVTCDPRAIKVYRKLLYSIHYICRSHVWDAELELKLKAYPDVIFVVSVSQHILRGER